MTETYEQMRDSTSGDLGGAWKGSDRQLAQLKDTYRTLQEDPRYTEEYKAEKAWQTYTELNETISAGRTKAKELLEKEARSHEQMSLPRPSGETLLTNSTDRLLAAQNQASRIVRMAERQERLSETSPIGRKRPQEILEAEYRRGIQAGGVEGAAACKGALMAAEELGIPQDTFLDALRGPEHFEQLQKAQRYRLMMGTLAKHVPEPPFRKPASASTALAGGVPWRR